MSLSKNQLKHVCLLQKGHKQCRYLAQDNKQWGEWNCLKKTPRKDIIDEELKDTMQELVKNGQDIKKQGIPCGDNCSGYLFLRTVQQGYDVKTP